MTRQLILAVVLLLTTASAPFGVAQGKQHLDEAKGAEKIVATFSIVARDPATGELGVAVQSRAFAAGARVPFAKAGVGAIATQAAANGFYGPEGLELLEKGLSPEDVVKRLTDADEGRDSRQLAVIDAKGRVKAYTGAKTNAWAGHIEGENYSVQGNILTGEAVVREMARAFETSKGELAERMMNALDAGQAAGGDARGMQAGGILVVKPVDGSGRLSDRWVDIRVDDSPNPFTELRRLLNIVLAARQSQLSGRLAAEGKYAEAIETQKKAISMNPTDDQLLYGLAQRYAQAGDAASAAAMLQKAIAKHERWRELAGRNQAFDKVRADPAFQKVITGKTGTR
jgi:uncharacterized Ntn-hydrolase superfamily protein